VRAVDLCYSVGLFIVFYCRSVWSLITVLMTVLPLCITPFIYCLLAVPVLCWYCVYRTVLLLCIIVVLLCMRIIQLLLFTFMEIRMFMFYMSVVSVLEPYSVHIFSCYIYILLIEQWI
jgi:hypothetical protein